MWQAANVSLFIHFFIQYLFHVFYVPVIVLGVYPLFKTVNSPCPDGVYSLVTPLPKASVSPYFEQGRMEGQ